MLSLGEDGSTGRPSSSCVGACWEGSRLLLVGSGGLVLDEEEPLVSFSLMDFLPGGVGSLLVKALGRAGSGS